VIRRPNLRLLSLSILLVLAASACATVGARRSGAALLRVENRSSSDVVVYLADGNTPFRLGRVAALDRARLPIPAAMAHLGVRVLVRPVDGDGVYAAESVLPGAGGVVALTIQPLLAHSRVSVVSYGPMER
jgi:hypothetical protein